MSAVGPRPALPVIVPHYTEDERRRLEVRPGLAGAGTKSMVATSGHFTTSFVRTHGISRTVAAGLTSLSSPETYQRWQGEEDALNRTRGLGNVDAAQSNVNVDGPAVGLRSLADTTETGPGLLNMN